MTANEAAALTALAERIVMKPAKVGRAMEFDYDGTAFVPPRLFGGTTNSHHARTAERMVPKGWVEQHRNEGPVSDRPTYSYRITPLGHLALVNHNALRGMV